MDFFKSVLEEMPQMIDRIFVSTEPFTEQGRGVRSPEECFQYCLQVSLNADRFLLLGFRADEMPKPLIHVHRATELVLRSEPSDDIVDFFIEIEWSAAIVEETIGALEAIGANEHARFLAALHQYLMGRGYSVKRSDIDEINEVVAQAAQDHLSPEILQKRYGNFGVDGDNDLDRRWRTICLQAVKYMDGWTNIVRVPDGAHNDAELQKYFESKPEIAQRLSEIEKENSRPPQTSRWW
jgi:hypothetical protein